MDTDAGFVSLEADECWALLRSTDIGRLAVIVDGRPEIFPLNYVVDHGTVVFRSASGTKLTSLRDNGAVAFEIDGYEKEHSIAWSVVLHGALEPIVSFDVIETETLPLYPLQASPKPRFVRVVPRAVTGRRFSTVDHSWWHVRPATPQAAWE